VFAKEALGNNLDQNDVQGSSARAAKVYCVGGYLVLDFFGEGKDPKFWRQVEKKRTFPPLYFRLVTSKYFQWLNKI